jgi:leukotriene-A4 hydrolase
MENPCLTFVTPALLAGDRSMTNVIAHEIAHSWTGNLVTNKNWNNFWMNEGFTKFLERKISELMSGEDISNIEALSGLINLDSTIKGIGETHSFTSLNPDLRNVFNEFYIFFN